MKEIINKYFPDGCPLCREAIFFNEETFIYFCRGCGAFVSAHRDDTEFTAKFQPTGYLANKEVNLLRKAVLDAMKPLFLERVKIQGRHNTIETSLVNVLHKDYCVRLRLDDEEIVYGKVISNTDQTDYKIFIIDSGKTVTVAPEELENVTNRDKTKIWLAQKLGLKVSECNIKHLNEKQLEKALEVLTEGVNESRQQAIDSS